jgi:hypothetical protein
MLSLFEQAKACSTNKDEALLVCRGIGPAPSRASHNEQTEFFEKKIRPLLVERCYGCHGPESKPPAGGLRLDTRDGVRKGGDSGPALVPGDPTQLLIEAISYKNPDFKMPPSGKQGRTDRRPHGVDQDGSARSARSSRAAPAKKESTWRKGASSGRFNR